MADPNRPSCCAPQRSETAANPRASEAFTRVTSGASDGMVLLPGGAFLMGTEDTEGFPADGEGPVREVHLKPFWIDRCAVTTTEFGRFVEATGYVTEAERFGWSYVFHLHVPKKIPFEGQVPNVPWWRKVSKASWQRPEGPGSNLRGRKDHPVTHVSWNDAQAYCQWAGKRLPTEAEWEYAARGGLVGQKYAWGDELTPAGRHQCNIFQGTFPTKDTAEDGFSGTCPVRSYPANGYGLYCMSGNVWEWCHDWFSPTWHLSASRDNPSGPPTGQRRVQRGGSFLCHTSYCNRYRVAARTGNTPDSATTNNGFRCVRDV